MMKYKIRGDLIFVLLCSALFVLLFYSFGFPGFKKLSAEKDPGTRHERSDNKVQHMEQNVVPRQQVAGGERPPERNDLFLIPGDDVLKTMSEADILKTYWRYINGIQTVCNNIVRFGTLQDGGKDICLEEAYVPSKPCIVYSFGCGFHFDFENAVHEYYGCETHTFDPTINIKGKEHQIPKHVKLNLEGLSGKEETTSQGWKMKTFKTFLKERNHENSVIDLLKIDIEGSEYAALMDTFKTDILSRVRQLSMEVHFARFNPKNLLDTRPLNEKDPSWGDVPPYQQLAVLRILYEKGFRIFMREHNLNSFAKAETTGGAGAMTTVNELCFINTKFRK